ncbi:MAG TPA: hypothetical protein VMW56_05845, partial [Candidatus Margulisiibacteriota bacterium]|nr:hypothetical protein [Candidatus Margulisiibacteriota bacterium]
VNTFGSNYDTILAAFTGTCGALAPLPGACNDDASGLQSQISVAVTAGTTYFFLVTAYGPSGGTLVLQLSLGSGGVGTPSATPTPGVRSATPTVTRTTAPPTRAPNVGNDACSSAIGIIATPYSGTTSTLTATTEASDPSPSCGNHSRARSVWYRFTAPASGTLTANTFGSGYDTILAVYAGSCGALSPVAGGCNDDTSGLQSRVAVAVTAGTTYYFLVTAYQGSGGTLNFSLAF